MVWNMNRAKGLIYSAFFEDGEYDRDQVLAFLEPRAATTDEPCIGFRMVQDQMLPEDQPKPDDPHSFSFCFASEHDVNWIEFQVEVYDAGRAVICRSIKTTGAKAIGEDDSTESGKDSIYAPATESGISGTRANEKKLIDDC